jgi:hypothetical protein
MVILFCILFFFYFQEQTTPVLNPVNEIEETIKDTSKTTLTIELVGYLPIGWGTRYTGRLISVDSGTSPVFNDSIFDFYEGVGSTPLGPNVLDLNKTIKIALKKSGERTNQNIHWPPNYDSGLTDKDGVVWNLVKP